MPSQLFTSAISNLLEKRMKQENSYHLSSAVCHETFMLFQLPPAPHRRVQFILHICKIIKLPCMKDRRHFRCYGRRQPNHRPLNPKDPNFLLGREHTILSKSACQVSLILLNVSPTSFNLTLKKKVHLVSSLFPRVIKCEAQYLQQVNTE